MKLLLFVFILIQSTIVQTIYANEYNANYKKHVIFIGLDGCQKEAFYNVYQSIKNKHRYSALKYLMQHSIIDNYLYAGGHPYDNTQQLTISEPGWTTLLTGVWGNEHHIRLNHDLEDNRFNNTIPTAFNYIKNYLSKSTVVSLTDWQSIQLIAGFQHYGSDSADINNYYPSDNLQELHSADKKMTQDAVSMIQSQTPPTFLFLHYGNIDEAGHHFGYSSDSDEYTKAIKETGAYINALFEAIQDSEKNGNQWLVLITTDHGGHLNIHGTQGWDDKSIFGIFYTSHKNLHFIKSMQGQTTILPTILHFLNLPSEAYNSLYDSVIGKAPRIPLYIQYDADSLQEQTVPQPIISKWPYLEPYLKKIKQIFYADNKYYIFLKNHTYFSYDILQKKLDNNPRSIAKNWPELKDYINKIKFIISGADNNLIFLRDRTYLRYNFREHRTVQERRPITNDWPDLKHYLGKIKNAFYAGNNNYYFFLNNNQYIIYNISLNQISKGPIPIIKDWPQLSGLVSDINTAFYGCEFDYNKNCHGKYYFFLKKLPYR